MENDKLVATPVPNPITPEEAARMPGLRSLKVGVNQFQISLQNSLSPEDIVRSCFAAMHVFAANKQFGPLVQQEIARSVGGWLQKVGVKNNADDVIAKLKARVDELEAELKEKG